MGRPPTVPADPQDQAGLFGPGTRAWASQITEAGRGAV
jgi:hypothetical protein